MRNVIDLYDAKTKLEYLSTFNRQDAINRVTYYFKGLNFFEETLNKPIYAMNATECKAAIHASDIAPATLESAYKFKKFVTTYWQWAKETGREVSPDNPLKSIRAMELCTTAAVERQFVKSIDHLYALTQEVGKISSENARWSYMTLILLMVYDGAPQESLGLLRYDQIDFDTQILTFNGRQIKLSEITCSVIQEIHQFKAVNFSKSYHMIRNVTDNGYVFPRFKSGMKPFIGKEARLNLANYKKKTSALEHAEWCTLGSVALAGQFYRIHYKLEENTLDARDDFTFKLWESTLS